MSVTFQENTIVHADVLDGMKAVPDGVASLVWTSPPYNVQIRYGDHMDNMPYLDYIQWLKSIWSECYRALRPGGRLIVQIDATTNLQNDGRDRMNCIYADNHQICKEIGFMFYQEHVWVKQNRCGKKTAWGSYLSPSMPSVLRSHEYCLVYSKEQYNLEGDPDDADMTDVEFNLFVGSEWHVPPETRNLGGHPVPFPEELARRAIKLYTYRNDLVIDPFSGTGTTCYVAKMNGRRYFGIDNDKHFVDFGNDRCLMADEIEFDPSMKKTVKTRREKEGEIKALNDGMVDQFE